MKKQWNPSYLEVAEMDAAGICPASIDGDTGKPITEGETAHKWEPQLSSEDYNKPVYACSECGATCNHSASFKQANGSYKCADCGATIK